MRIVSAAAYVEIPDDRLSKALFFFGVMSTCGSKMAAATEHVAAMCIMHFSITVVVVYLEIQRKWNSPRRLCNLSPSCRCWTLVVKPQSLKLQTLVWVDWHFLVFTQYKLVCYWQTCYDSKFKRNKTVLPRERKRHIARRVANTHSAVLCGGGGGSYPIQTWPGGGTASCPDWGYAIPSCLGRGYLILAFGGTGVTPDRLPQRTLDQWKHYGMEMRYHHLPPPPPPPPRCEQTHIYEDIIFPILRMGGYNLMSWGSGAGYRYLTQVRSLSVFWQIHRQCYGQAFSKISFCCQAMYRFWWIK